MKIPGVGRLVGTFSVLTVGGHCRMEPDRFETTHQKTKASTGKPDPHDPKHQQAKRGRVGLFVDTYAGNMGQKFTQGSPTHDSGWMGSDLSMLAAASDLRSARAVLQAASKGEAVLAKLDAYGDKTTPIVVLEPSCASSLGHDLPDLIKDKELGMRVVKRLTSIEALFASADVPLTSPLKQWLVHQHCHDKAVGTSTAANIDDVTIVGSTPDAVNAGARLPAFRYIEKVADDRFLPAAQQAHQNGETIVACGISCRHQLKDLAGIQALHWVEAVEPVETTMLTMTPLRPKLIILHTH